MNQAWTITIGDEDDGMVVRGLNRSSLESFCRGLLQTASGRAHGRVPARTIRKKKVGT